LIPPLLQRAPFRNFWLGQTISVFGDQITPLAIPVVAVLVLDAQPAVMGLLTAVGLLPHLLFSLPAGVRSAARPRGAPASAGDRGRHRARPRHRDDPTRVRVTSSRRSFSAE
jgi:hypothetical protein